MKAVSGLNNKISYITVILAGLFLLVSCSPHPTDIRQDFSNTEAETTEPRASDDAEVPEDLPDLSQEEKDMTGKPVEESGEEEESEKLVKYFEDKYGDSVPDSWGEKVDGVITRIETEDKVIALTFDACGGKSDGYDERIINFLIQEEIPATLFINSRWIEKYPDEFAGLAANDLFEIANHGHKHKPLSVSGKSAYGIKGTENVREVVEEILLNEEKIIEITGQKPLYFRSGTAYYDETAVKIANELGYKVVNYNVLGDAGATFNKRQIVKACKSASPGSIILFHMNRPETNIAEGIIEGITELRNSGYRFVKLSDYHDHLK